MHLRFSRTPLFVKVVLTLLIVLPLFIPVNFVLVQPGPATNLFPKLLSIKSSVAQSYPARGGAFLLTIYVSNPDASILGFQALTCWAEATCVAMPRSVFYKKNTTSEAEYKIGKKDMKKSQSAALSASKALIARHYPAINLSRVSDSSIKIGLKNTGGPSGGLIFSLGLIELLSQMIYCRDGKLQQQEQSHLTARSVLSAASKRRLLARRKLALLSFWSPEKIVTNFPQRLKASTLLLSAPSKRPTPTFWRAKLSRRAQFEVALT